MVYIRRTCFVVKLVVSYVAEQKSLHSSNHLELRPHYSPELPWNAERQHGHPPLCGTSLVPVHVAWSAALGTQAQPTNTAKNPSTDNTLYPASASILLPPESRGVVNLLKIGYMLHGSLHICVEGKALQLR